MDSVRGEKIALGAIIFALSCLAAGIAGAHDIWLSPERFDLSKGDTLTVHLLVGHEFKTVRELPLRKDVTTRFELLSSKGAFDLLADLPESSSPILRRPMYAEGLALLVVEHDFTYLELSRDAFSEYLEHEELQEIEKAWRAMGQRPVERERYARTLKSLVRVGESAGADAHRPIDDADLRFLEGMTNVKLLDLRGTRVTDTGLAYLSGLGSLKSLDLSDTQVSDAGLVHLRRLANLQTLDLAGTRVTDAGLAHLQGLTRLRCLILGRTEVTEAGTAQLEGSTDLLVLYRRQQQTVTRMPPLQLLGPKLDIRLRQNPYQLDPGDDLEVLILFDGEPLADKLVWAFNRDPEGLASASKARTNARGIARFTLDRKGSWLVRLVHMLPRPDAPEVDWESYWASYSFKLD